MDNNHFEHDLSTTTLPPGQRIRPIMNTELARSIVKTLYGFDVTHIEEFKSYDDKNYYVRVSSEHCNPNVTAVRTDGYILKVLNTYDSKSDHVDAEHQIQSLLKKGGIQCPQLVLTISGLLYSREKIFYTANGDTDDDQRPHGVHVVRLMTFIPGKMFVTVPYTPQLLYKLGRFVARIDQSLEGFYHKALEDHKTIWNLECIAGLHKFLYAVKDDSDRRLITGVLKAYQEEVVPNYGSFSRGAIHGDCNEQNILVQAKLDGSVTEYSPIAILDFGDNMYTYYIFEVAYCIMYMMLDSKIIEPFEVGGHILAGYLRERSLNDAEFDALYLCIAGRFITSLVMGYYTYELDPGNEYVLESSKEGWVLLRKLMETDKGDLYAMWRKIISSYN